MSQKCGTQFLRTLPQPHISLTAEQKGKWTEAEETALIKAISKLTGELRLEDIPWHCVAELVPRRNDKQCRRHWLVSSY